MEQREILIKSSIDKTMQPSLFYKSENDNRPMLVGLHTWSFDRFNQIDNMLPYAERYDFNLLLPDFRGPNLSDNPNCEEACGSILAKNDIKDAVDYIKNNYNIDENNIFLLGLSGGGHMALLMAGFIPYYFKAIGAFVPISDLNLWSTQNSYYKEHIIKCCKTKEEMLYRSPIYYIDTIAKSNLKIFHGKYDDVVPFTQSLGFYNDIIKKYPDCSVYLDIFDGSHEINMEEAMNFIMSQYNQKKLKKVTG